MILVTDESVDHPVIKGLQGDGHEVLDVAARSPSIPDETVLDWANDRGAVLVTADKDFGELVFRRKLVHAGVILLRLAGLPNDRKADVVVELLRHRADELPGRFTIVSPGQARIRRISP